MATTGTATVSFGTTPVDSGTVVVSGQAAILATSLVECWIAGNTAGAGDTANSEQDHLQAAALIKTVPGIPVAGVGFTIYCDVIAGLVTGDFKVFWVWN